jgi:putative tricarboxylic transport membrane protein
MRLGKTLGEMKMRDIILAIGIIAVSAVYLRAALNLPQLAIGDPLGPQIFPILIAVGLALSGGLLLIEQLRKKSSTVPAEEIPQRHSSRYEYLLLAAIVVWTAAYYAAFEPVGYIAATLIYLFGLLCVFQRGRWILNLVYAGAFTAAVYLLFGHVLHVVLPAGILAM